MIRDIPKKSESGEECGCVIFDDSVYLENCILNSLYFYIPSESRDRFGKTPILKKSFDYAVRNSLHTYFQFYCYAYLTKITRNIDFLEVQFTF